MKEKIKQVYKRLLPGYEEELLKELDGMDSILDLGCGVNSPIRFVSGSCYKVGVDAFEEAIDISKGKDTHHEYHHLNILTIAEKFKPKSFDCVVLLDVIEHVTKTQALTLLAEIEPIARKKVIIFTPNGFVNQTDDQNPFQEHKSGWTTDDFRRLGYTTTGINGIYFLRGEKSQLQWKPRLFWLLISDLTQVFTKHNPSYAYQLLSVKELSRI